jgi:hypothetical protein
MFFCRRRLAATATCAEAKKIRVDSHKRTVPAFLPAENDKSESVAESAACRQYSDNA